MTPAQHEHQAQAFLDWHAKHPGLDWELAFEKWSVRKRFAFADYLAVKSIVHDRLLSTDIVSTDPMDWLRDGAA